MRIIAVPALALAAAPAAGAAQRTGDEGRTAKAVDHDELRRVSRQYDRLVE